MMRARCWSKMSASGLMIRSESCWSLISMLLGAGNGAEYVVVVGTSEPCSGGNESGKETRTCKSQRAKARQGSSRSSSITCNAAVCGTNWALSKVSGESLQIHSLFFNGRLIGMNSGVWAGKRDQISAIRRKRRVSFRFDIDGYDVSLTNSFPELNCVDFQ